MMQARERAERASDPQRGPCVSQKCHFFSAFAHFFSAENGGGGVVRSPENRFHPGMKSNS